jgi:cobalt/nickel transport protein
MKMSRKAWYTVGFGLIIAICVAAFMLQPGAEFGGADGQGEEEIGNINPDYQPWFESLWTPPGETESLLFALQAAIGAVIIGYFIGNEHGKRTALQKIGDPVEVQVGPGKAEAADK